MFSMNKLKNNWTYCICLFTNGQQQKYTLFKIILHLRTVILEVFLFIMVHTDLIHKLLCSTQIGLFRRWTFIRNYIIIVGIISNNSYYRIKFYSNLYLN